MGTYLICHPEGGMLEGPRLENGWSTVPLFPKRDSLLRAEWQYRQDDNGYDQSPSEKNSFYW